MPGKHSATPSPAEPPAADHVDSPGPGHRHAHHHGPPPSIAIADRARISLIAFLVVVAVATVIGAVTLLSTKSDAHPSSPYAAAGVTFPRATVTSVGGACLGGGCRVVTVMINSGADQGKIETVQVPDYVIAGGLTTGDHIGLQRNPAVQGAPVSYSWWDNVDRSEAMWLLVGLFVFLVLVVARLRGLLAIVGLCLAALVVLKFMLPALLGGQNGMEVALVGSAAIMYVVLYLAHGWSLRTSTALAGTLVGTAIVAGLGWYASGLARLSGAIDDNAIALNGLIHIDLRGIAICGLILVSLGLLNDVTVTQASAVWELRAAAPQASRRDLFASGMRIGRDHIASTIYTIVFAYTGTALMLLLLAAVYSRPYGQLLSTDAVAEDVVRTLAAAIGLVLAVPVTTAIAVAVVGAGAEAPAAEMVVD